jgi:hypothetical protein
VTRVSVEEFQELELRCHSLLADVELHDVWAIPLRGGGEGRTMHDVAAIRRLRGRSNLPVRSLFALRRALGARLGWDRERPEAGSDSYLHRLTAADRARSEIAPGTREGAFCTLYLFSHEALAEVRNATVHAFLATALLPGAGGYRLYWAIYVKPVSPLTRFYMALIDPFRRLIVYPALLRQTQAAWSRTYA